MHDILGLSSISWCHQQLGFVQQTAQYDQSAALPTDQVEWAQDVPLAEHLCILQILALPLGPEAATGWSSACAAWSWTCPDHRAACRTGLPKQHPQGSLAAVSTLQHSWIFMLVWYIAGDTTLQVWKMWVVIFALAWLPHTWRCAQMSSWCWMMPWLTEHVQQLPCAVSWHFPREPRLFVCTAAYSSTLGCMVCLVSVYLSD